MSNISSISACLIVKNESANLDFCLRSIKKHVDQIVVVDTGSTDTTPQIASNFGADLYYFKWNSDFSAARNFAIEHAHSEWILIIDADEYLEKDFDLKELNIEDKIGGINLVLVNYLNKKRDQVSKHRYTRIFRNDQNIRFRGQIHEQIRESIEEQNFEILESDLQIHHTGYVDTSQEKKERNKKLLEEELAKNNDDWSKYNLADTEFSLGNHEKSLALFRSIINSNELSEEQLQKVRIRVSQIHLAKERYKESIKMLDFVCKDIELEGLRKYILGACYLHTKDFKGAKVYYKSDEVQRSGLVDKETVYKALFVIEQLEKNS